MAVTPQVFYRGAASTTTSPVPTLYTTAATETAIITNIVITNTAALSATVTMQIDGIDILNTVQIAANTTVTIDLKQPLIATGTAKTIKGYASATTVKFHISGVTV